MSNACKIRHVVMPVKRRSTGSRRTRIMRNLHTKRRRQSRRKHSRGRKRKHSRRKHSRKHHRRHSRNLGRAPKLDGEVLRNVVLGNLHPSQEIIDHIPEIKRLHELIIRFHRNEPKHGFNMAKRMEIRRKLMPKPGDTDEKTHELQKEAMESIIKDLETMGLETLQQRTVGERTKQKQYDADTEALLKSGR